MKPNEVNPILSLQENASAFFEKVYLKNSLQMECKKGCSKCCQTDIGVFEIEADRIRNWFYSLSLESQAELKNLWKMPVEKGSCAFLNDNACTIYEARPLICRTQGLPLFLSSENALDYCPLNFTSGDPEKSDWLNLERMNTMLSIAAKSVSKESRIRLVKLKEELSSQS